MGLLLWVIVGVIAGWLSGQVMRGRGFGLLTDLFLGIAGGLIGGWFASSLFGVANAADGINITSILVAFLAAMLLIVLVRLFQGRGRGPLAAQ